MHSKPKVGESDSPIALSVLQRSNHVKRSAKSNCSLLSVLTRKPCHRLLLHSIGEQTLYSMGSKEGGSKHKDVSIISKPSWAKQINWKKKGSKLCSGNRVAAVLGLNGTCGRVVNLPTYYHASMIGTHQCYTNI